jgi:universal stress protein A
MKPYRKVLVAVDLSNESTAVIKRALDVCDQQSDIIHLLHVVEPVAAAYPIDAYAINVTRLQEEALQIASERLTETAEAHGLLADNVHTATGPAAAEIRNKADALGCDLIVIGSHGNAGWKLLLGATANKVLHGANCDVLTVRVGN